jgi:hypothetical protein
MRPAPNSERADRAPSGRGARTQTISRAAPTVCPEPQTGGGATSCRPDRGRAHHRPVGVSWKAGTTRPSLRLMRRSHWWGMPTSGCRSPPFEPAPSGVARLAPAHSGGLLEVPGAAKRCAQMSYPLSVTAGGRNPCLHALAGSAAARTRSVCPQLAPGGDVDDRRLHRRPCTGLSVIRPFPGGARGRQVDSRGPNLCLAGH